MKLCNDISFLTYDGIENHDIYLVKVIGNTVLPKVDQASFVSRYFLVIFRSS